MKRILVVNANWLGDVLFSTPSIRAIRKKFPESYLACLVPFRAENVLLRNPHLNEVIVYDDRVSFLSPSFWRMVLKLKKKNFDSAFFFHRSKTKVLLAKLAGIEERFGYSSPARDRFLTRICPAPPVSEHKIDYFLNLLECFEIPSDGRSMDFVADPAAEKKVWELLVSEGVRKGEPYAVVHAGGNWDLKRWPAEHFAQWIHLYKKEFPGKIILCGTEPENGIAIEIKSHFSKEVLSVCGKTSFDELAHLLKNAEFLLSNDSGPIHLAAALKTKIVGIFGPTSPQLTGPISEAPVKILWKDVGCDVPCYYQSCHYRVCMDWIAPEEVFEKTKQLLEVKV